MASVLSHIKDVIIDSEGIFKYVLLKVSERSGEFKKVVRGNNNATFHADIVEPFVREVASNGYDVSCLGGGTITMDNKNKLIKIHGYSLGYGKANHAETAEIINKYYNSDFKIEFSEMNE